MIERDIHRGVENSLLLRPIPDLPREHLSAFLRESLWVKKAISFSQQELNSQMKKNNGMHVMAIDIGGTKIDSATFVVSEGSLRAEQETFKTMIGGDGKDFFQFLCSLSKEAREKSIPVGISTTGIPDGTRLIAATRLPLLLRDLKKYSSDLKELFPTLSQVVNDAVAAAMGGIFEASRKNYQDIKNALVVV